ncbi:mobilization protein MobC [Nostoc sp. NIES-4103]|nr:mobilization protein MobC [Nostoc sp. NIES-4103]
MARTKSGQKIPIEKLQASIAELEKLEEKPKEELTLRESIYFLRTHLQSALKKGYSYQDLSKILADQEVKVSAATIKQYLTDIEKEESTKKPRTKSRQVKQADSAALDLSTSSATPPEAELTLFFEKLNADVGQSTIEIPQKQSSTDSIEPEQKITKAVRRRNPKTSQPKANILDDFNQY